VVSLPVPAHHLPTLAVVISLKSGGGEGGGQEQAKNDNFNTKATELKKKNQHESPQQRKIQDNSNGERISRFH
jgi:hypothetical protein